jgi:hypothetical protein
MISANEIAPGLVLHLDPDELLSKGGTFTCVDSRRVKGGHFFVCVSVEGELGRWLPLYTRARIGRQPLTNSGRSGHPKWTCGTWYWHSAQIWSASHLAIIAAASAGSDMSEAGVRNNLDAACLPTV